MEKTKLFVIALISMFSVMSAVKAQEEVSEEILQEDIPAVELQGESSVSANLSIDFANAYIDYDGCVISDSFVVQPGLNLFINSESLPLPIEIEVWGNFATDKFAEQTRNNAFTEITLSLGTTYEWEESGVSASLSINTTQYPNMEGWGGEEFLAANIQKVFEGAFVTSLSLTGGAYAEFALTGDCDNNFNLLPYLSAEYEFTEDLSATLSAQFHYLAEEGGDNGWGSFSILPSVTYKNFSVFAQYFVQLDDDIYSDEDNDAKDYVYGVGYSVEF